MVKMLSSSFFFGEVNSPILFFNQGGKMSETALLIELVKNIGFPAVIFAIWYIYHKSQVKTFEDVINNNFKVLKDLLETNQYHAAILSRIESKIDTNLWCPILKRSLKHNDDEVLYEHRKNAV